MNKQNLDKLFQEKLKDFREIPDGKVWKSIEESLNQHKGSRRVIPIWWKLSGVAALLAIAFFVFNPFESSEIPDIERTEPAVNTEINKDPASDTNKEGAFESNAISASEDEGIPSDKDEEVLKSIYKDESSIAESSEQKSARTISEDEASSADSELEVAIKSEKSALYEQDKPLAQAEAKEGLNSQNEDSPSKTLELPEDREVIVQSENQRKEANENRKLSDPSTEVADLLQEKVPEDESGKKSIFDEINKQQEEETLVESSDRKWSVGPSIAPVYFNSFGEGSPVHSNFTSNSKSGNINLSYGVAVAYEVTDKLSLRSGLHKVNYGYNTNDITFSSSLVASTSSLITNIDYTNNSRSLVVESSASREAIQDFDANDIIAQNPSRSGVMVQEFGYVEVPMELNYALIDRKLNINIVGGFSSLFLVDNSVTLESSGSSTEMGEANNLNDVNFSTNIGLGINYELNNTMKVHLEPMFKYQMNMFSDIEGNFRPYTLGVYTGISFKF